MQPTETTIAFVGTGVMGAPMAGHLLDADYRVRVHNRTRSKAEPVLSRGAEWADSPGQAVAGADVVITMVGFPSDVQEVYLGSGSILESANEGALLIDMSTSSPALAGRIADAARNKRLDALDAPVSGGDVGARDATLTIMVGGERGAFERALPVLEVMGKTVLYHGGPGAGQHCKMANQIAIAASMLGLAECLAYSAAAGLDRARVLETLIGGSARSWTLENYGPRVLGGDFQPGFYVKHFVKDLRIALVSAESMRLDLPGLELAKRLYEALASGGGSELGTQAVWLLYAEPAEREAAGVLGGVTVGAVVDR
jgi:3-hydroxyisobutyrate dehydrogenase